MEKVYDMIIVGGGPGGYTAALYGARAGLDVLVLEKMAAGGQMTLTHQIDNYPGFPNGVDGFTLSENMRAGAERFGAQSRFTTVESLDLRSSPKRVMTKSGVFLATTVVISTGASPRKLGLPREEELTGAGVSYCAHCDGMFYRGKTAMVVGGGNSAVAEALHLSRICKEVILVHRRDTLRATALYLRQLQEAGNIRFVWNSTPAALLGQERLQAVQVRNVLTGALTTINCDGLFVSIGRDPATELVKEQLALDASGYILAGESTQTALEGVYAVGDVRSKALRQIVTAVADGAIAAHHAEEYLSAPRPENSNF